MVRNECRIILPPVTIGKSLDIVFDRCGSPIPLLMGGAPSLKLGYLLAIRSQPVTFVHKRLHLFDIYVVKARRISELERLQKLLGSVVVAPSDSLEGKLVQEPEIDTSP